MDVGNFVFGSSAFSKSSSNIWKFSVQVLLKPSLENFEHYFASLWDECNCVVVEIFLALSSFEIGMKKWAFPVLWPLLSFPNLLAYWVQHFHSIIFQDLKQLNWNSITSTSFVQVMLPKVHLTLHSSMSGSRWVITPLWFSQSWRSFLYSSSVYSCHIFLIASASISCIPSLFFIVPLSAWNVPLVSLNFLKRSLVYPILLFFSISSHWSLRMRKAFLSLLAILWNYAFRWLYLSSMPLLLLFAQLFKASSDNHFAFFAFLLLGDGFDHCLPYIVTNLCPSFCRHSIRSNLLILFVTSAV